MSALTETAWERAKRDARRTYQSAEFAIASTLVGLLAAACALWAAAASETSTQADIAITVLAGVIGVAITVLAVAAFELAAAPIRQRNELRADWPASHSGERGAPDVRLALLNFARRADDEADKLWRQGGTTSSDYERYEKWTEEVVAFLDVHGRAHGDAFINSPAQGQNLIQKYRTRATCLREVADKIAARHGGV